MEILSLILLVFALVCLGLAAFGISGRRVSLGWLGLAAWMLTLVIGALTGIDT